MHASSADDNLPTQPLGHKPTDTPPTAAGAGPAAAVPTTTEWPSIPGYEIEALLGQGGMGLVFRARHLGLKRPVALKVLRPHAGTVTDAARFEREARAVARLSHPHIVQVHDAGTYRDAAGVIRPFLALEFVAGPSLDRVLREAALPPRQAAALARDLARALAAVHAAGVVHRDIKPANVLLQRSEVGGQRSEVRDQRAEVKRPLTTDLCPLTTDFCPLTSDLCPKLTDFGLALTGDDPALTRGEQLIGTPGYLAPEQVRAGARAAGPASDLHALGAVLYECLTGRPAFKAATIHEALELVQHAEPVPVRRLSPGVPRDLETITLKCLEKDPARRYASAAELADDLDRFLTGRPVRARRISVLERGWRRARRQPALAGLALACTVLALALVATAAWYAGRLGQAEAQRHAARTDADAAREIAATSKYHALLAAARGRADRHEPGWRHAGLGDVRAAAALPTRARAPSELRDLAAQLLLGTDLVPRPELAPGFCGGALAFHPTRPALAVAEFKAWGWAGGTVALLDLDGRPLRRLSFPTHAVHKGSAQDGARALAISPDGQWLVVGARSGWLHRWDLTRAETRPISWRGHKAELRDVCFCPLNHALFTAGADGAVLRWDMEDGWKNTHRVQALGRLDHRAACGDLLLIDGQTARRLARKTFEVTAGPVAAGGLGRLTAPTGPLVVVEGAQLKFLDAATGEVTGALRGPGLDAAHESAIDDVAVSPDSDLLASVDEATSHGRVWSLAGGRLLANLTLPDTPARVAWRSDGAMVAFLAGRRVMLFDVQRPAAQRVGGLHARPVQAAACLPAGRLATLAADRATGRGELAVWALSGATAAECQQRRPLALPEARLPARLAADDAGRWLAWVENGRVVRAPADRLAERRETSADEAWGVAVAGDGGLWYTSKVRLFAQGPSEGAPRHVWDNTISDKLTGLGGLWPVDCGPRYSLVGGRDGAVRLFAGGELVGNWPRSRRSVRGVALDEGERAALVGTAAGEVFLLDVPGGEVRAAPPAAHRDQVEAVAFLGGGLAATASADGELRLWRRDGGGLDPWLTLRFAGPVKALARDRAGGRLAVVLTGERAARVIDVGALRDELRLAGVE